MPRMTVEVTTRWTDSVTQFAAVRIPKLPPLSQSLDELFAADDVATTRFNQLAAERVYRAAAKEAKKFESSRNSDAQRTLRPGRR